MGKEEVSERRQIRTVIVSAVDGAFVAAAWLAIPVAGQGQSQTLPRNATGRPI
jgi:hypothetical protein